MNGFEFRLDLGVSLSWFGFVPTNFSLTPSSGIYSIDGQTPISFFVPAWDTTTVDALPLYNQLLFKTEVLSPGQHKLIVTYQGNNGTAPLALDAFIIQNATSSSTSNLGPKKSLPVAPLVGIIVGAVVGAIVLVLLLLLYIRRRRRAQKLKENSDTIFDPYTPSPRIQNHTSELPTLNPQFFSSKFSQREPLTPLAHPDLHRLQ